jgi:phospholipid/cholesterol/gamma-HCH transport system substrate-binding protein
VSGGIVAVVALTVLVFIVLTYARTGVLHGDKFRLYVAVPNAANLLEGSSVWLNGQRVGTVVSIRFAPATAPPDVRVIIGTDVLKTVRPLIRLDSRASLRSGGTIVGEPVVYIQSGTLAARGVVPGDTIRGAGKSDMEIAASRVTESLEQVPELLADAKIILARTKTAGSRMSAMMSADYGHGSFGTQTSALMAKLSGGRGSVGRIMRDPDIRVGATRSMASVDSLRALLASRMDEFGRFRRDTTLLVTVRELRRDVAQLRELAASPTGTVGRVAIDSALRRGLDSAFAELTALFADIKKHPLRYSRVF